MKIWIRMLLRFLLLMAMGAALTLGGSQASPLFLPVLVVAGALILLPSGRRFAPARHHRRGFLPPRIGPPTAALALLLALFPTGGIAQSQIPISSVTGLQAALNRIKNNVVYATDYGVRADGSTDDKAALNAAWTAASAKTYGGVVQLPAGVIYLATKWVPADPGAGKTVWIRGAGVGLTTFKFDTTVANNSYFISFEGSSGDHFSPVKISDCSFDTSEWNDGTTRINTGTAQAVGAASFTLAAGASGTDDYYNNMYLCVLTDSGNASAEYQLALISDYDGTTKVATVPTWPAGRTPTAAAKYALLLDGSDATDQMTRGVGRVGFTYVDGVVVDSVKKTGGHGFLDFRVCTDILVNNVTTSVVTENSINFLGPTSYSDVCARATVSNFSLESGEGIDSAADHLNITNGTIRVLGQDDEGIDLNLSHYVNISNVTIIGGKNGINCHGAAVSASPLTASYDINISNVVCREFTTAGFTIQFAASSGAEQTATHGFPKHFNITNCVFTSTVSGAKGMEPSWSNTTYPIYVDDVNISGCYIDTDGDAISAPLNRRLTIRDTRAKSTNGEGFICYAASGTTSTDLRLYNVYATGKASGTTTGGGFEIAQAQNVLLSGCRAETVTQGYAIRCINVMKGVTIENSEVIGAHHHGVNVEWNSASYIDSDLDLKLNIRNNIIKDWGSATSGRRGLYVYVNQNSATYTGINIVGNQLLLPVVANNGHLGIYLQTTGTVTHWRLQDNYITTAITTNANRWTTSATFASPFLASGNNPPIGNTVAKTANYTVTYADSGSLFSNTGASGAITFTLPTAIVGMEYRFYVGAAFELRVDPGANDKHQYGSLTGGIVSMADGEYLTSSSAGAFLHIICYDAAVGWVVMGDTAGGVGGIGAWTEQTP